MDLVRNMYFDIHGNPVERSKREYPYSYSAFAVFKRCFEETDKAAFSDRLFEENPEKFNNLSMDVFKNAGQNFSVRLPYDIETFLSRFLERRIYLTGIEEACNVGNGYPYWIFYYKDYGPLAP